METLLSWVDVRPGFPMGDKQKLIKKGISNNMRCPVTGHKMQSLQNSILGKLAV